MDQSLFEAARAALLCPEPAAKCAAVATLAADWRAGRLSLAAAPPPRPVPVPGRPPRPRLVAPRELPRRKLTNPEGRAAFLHTLAHIEFNAINLALDALYRFRELPRAFYDDWLQVAAEEALHFELLAGHLATLGHAYGDFPAHNGLWEMACRTDDDLLKRMALVPRVFEARGLDVTPGMIERLRQVGDEAAVAILRRIHRDEIGHVAIGNRWFRWACERAGVAPGPTFRALLAEYLPGRVRGPFDRPARLAAGFTPEELDELEALSS